ncbi:MAG TPA: homocysteine S-methyltransferase family protein [Dongiaceae bacterium]|nr:homocysteine S-methyltransferase family protein [Dongiaceae bacterium]
MASLQERLDRGDVVILDGAMGTELQRRGVPMDGVAWSGLAIETHPETVRAVHRDYLRAGAEILIANSFATSRHVLEAAGLGDRVAALNRRSIELAREAAASEAPDRQVWIAGSISSFVPSGDDRRRPTRAAERASYREQAALLAEAGADLLALEMIRDIDQACVIVEAAATTGLPIWVGFTCRLADDGRTVLLLGRDVERPLRDCMGPVLAAGPCTAVAVMHADLEATGRALDVVFENWAGPVVCYPECGEWANPDWVFGELAPETLASAAESWVGRGVRVVGGCCWIGPDHIAAMARRLSGRRWAKD